MCIIQNINIVAHLKDMEISLNKYWQKGLELGPSCRGPVICVLTKFLLYWSLHGNSLSFQVIYLLLALS